MAGSSAEAASVTEAWGTGAARVPAPSELRPHRFPRCCQRRCVGQVGLVRNRRVTCGHTARVRDGAVLVTPSRVILGRRIIPRHITGEVVAPGSAVVVEIGSASVGSGSTSVVVAAGSESTGSGAAVVSTASTSGACRSPQQCPKHR